MPFARYFCIFINVGLGELSLAGTASGVIGLNGYVTIPLIISGSRRTLIIQWGQARFGGSGGEDAGYLNDFPFAFPSACYGMIVSHVGHTPSGAGILSACRCYCPDRSLCDDARYRQAASLTWWCRWSRTGLSPVRSLPGPFQNVP